MDLGGARMKVYAGIDLHSSNNYVGIIDEEDRRLYQKRLPNRLEDVLPALDPFLRFGKQYAVEKIVKFIKKEIKNLKPLAEVALQ